MLKLLADAALKMLVSSWGHVNPKEENTDTTCRKSTPMPSAERLTPFCRANTIAPATRAARCACVCVWKGHRGDIQAGANMGTGDGSGVGGTQASTPRR
jgi:hypothetical protein